jgi:hypothetical protein
VADALLDHPAFDAARAALAATDGLAGQVDLAERWGLSRQRVTQLVREPGFPEPVAVVAGHPVWLAAQADRWRAMRELVLARARVEQLG